MTDETTGEVIAPTPIQISDALNVPFPDCAIAQKQGMDYISGDTAIRRLNKATGNNWNIRITNQEWRDLPTAKKQGEVILTLCHIVSVELTIPGLGTRAGMGVQEVQAGAGADAMCKGALTDALKVAAKQFGVALHLYGPDREAEGEHREAMNQKASNHSQEPRTAPQQQSGRQNSLTPQQAAQKAKDIHTMQVEGARVFGKGERGISDFREWLGSEGIESLESMTSRQYDMSYSKIQGYPTFVPEQRSDLADEEPDAFANMEGTTPEQQASWALESVK